MIFGKPYNLKAFLPTQQLADKNNKIFIKSFYGKRLMITPDKQITPDDDERFKTCLVCDGKGKVIVWDGELDEQTPDYENCESCEGEGFIKIEGWENEW